MKLFFSKIYWIFVSFFIIFLDLISKLWIQKYCVVGKTITFFSIIKCTLVINRGIAFGFFSYEGSWQKWVFSCVSMFILVFFIDRLIRLRKNFFLHFSYSVLIGGILGNTLDRIFHGFVIDFIDLNIGNFSYFPIFNIADLNIFIGTIFIFFYSLKEK